MFPTDIYFSQFTLKSPTMKHRLTALMMRRKPGVQSATLCSTSDWHLREFKLMAWAELNRKQNTMQLRYTCVVGIMCNHNFCSSRSYYCLSTMTKYNSNRIYSFQKMIELLKPKYPKYFVAKETLDLEASYSLQDLLKIVFLHNVGITNLPPCSLQEFQSCFLCGNWGHEMLIAEWFCRIHKALSWDDLADLQAMTRV